MNIKNLKSIERLSKELRKNERDIELLLKTNKIQVYIGYIEGDNRGTVNTRLISNIDTKCLKDLILTQLNDKKQKIIDEIEAL